MSGWASLALAATTGGLSHSFLDPDESAHYVNTLFLADWLRAGCPSPMGFARDFYAHFPKLSIGHWPPGWYGLLAPLFAVIRPSPFGAALLSAFVAGLPALIILWAMERGAMERAGARRWGVAAAFAYLLLPIVANEARYVRLDQPVALVAGLAAMAWFAASARPTLCRYLLFGALAAFATLTKGNGALVMLVPALDILMAARWRQLADGRLWLAAAATLLVVAPWYYVSFKIAAGGFNYAPGLPYAWLSLQADGAAILANLGWAGIAVAAFGAGAGWRDEASRPIIRLAIAMILATLLFQAAIPVALEDRYVLPAIPWLVVLIARGLIALARLHRWAPVAVGLVAALIVGPAVATLATTAPKPDIGATGVAERMRAAPGIWLIDGRAGGEGAMIAAAAYADGGRRTIWAARASQWLSTSDFMGRDYRLSVHRPAEARAVLDGLGVRGVVSIAEKGRLAYPHSALLRGAIALPGFVAQDRPFPRGAGSTLIATRLAPIVPQAGRLASGSGSTGVAAMGKAF
ncbi:ArnT family glycosyltransferase [Sphingomonas abietis]|uniref:Glycosyltransferase family 39 protein n=1 Tax=Sphingomonas abietis TaxID=3012344 RepID=A0ABY7NQ27_9SPHN|nr:glycosyltransferase family 39 protein [Sphingomonas abietis]WBO23637.1 glycosyltransferase family 39 protein [Sphingomonas abietis]